MDKQPKIEIYTRRTCGYCAAAKQVLDNLRLPYTEKEITNDPDGYSEMLKRAEGRHTVPQIFIDGKGIGGYTDLVALIRQSDQQ